MIPLSWVSVRGWEGTRETWILERGVELLITRIRHAIGRACR
jgi:hypothetical protein